MKCCIKHILNPFTFASQKCQHVSRNINDIDLKGEGQKMTKEYTYAALCGVISLRFALILIGSVSGILAVAVHLAFVVTELFSQYI